MSLADCKALRIKMAAEKYVQKQVHFEMAQRQSKLKDFEEMLQNVKISNLEKLSKRLEKNLLLKEEQLVRLVQEIETKRKRVVEIRNVSELIAIRKENERERLSQQQKEQKQQQLLQQQQQQDPRSKMYKSHIASTFVNSHYENIMGFHTNYADSVKPLQNETSMSKFRLDSIKCVNILLNLISSVHWQQKFDWFSLLLSGNCVEIGGTRVTPSQHPLGIRFINLLVAKMFVKKAETSMAVLNPTDGPIASLIVALWRKFPEFGKLLLACIYKQTILMVPYHMKQVAGQSDGDYLRSMGFVVKDNVCEDPANFVKRLTGLVRLYASIVRAENRSASINNMPHPHQMPHGIEFGWTWLASILNMDPIADVSATMVYEFLVIVGPELQTSYGKQFVKMIGTIQQFIGRLNRIDSGASKSRLESLIASRFLVN